MGAEAAKFKKHYTIEEYLKLEEQEDMRYEYYEGEVFAMAGGSMNHSIIAYNINRKLNDALGEECFSFQADVKVELKKDGAYVYPDVVLTCHADDVKDGYYIRNPLLIVEVLSPSTEVHDQRIKSIAYRRLPSLRYFLLVSQTEPLVQVYSRNASTALFQIQDFNSMDDVILFPELQFTISLHQIYQRVNFEETNKRNSDISPM